MNSEIKKMVKQIRLYRRNPYAMTPCQKRVLRVFGLIALLVVLFPPYREARINRYQARGSVLVRKVTTGGRGLMFLPRFLKIRGVTLSERGREERRVVLDGRFLAGEFAVIAVLGLFDYFLLCGLRRRSKRVLESRA